jgi:uncharacterized membrane protein YjfL (UPF0719 family)
MYKVEPVYIMNRSAVDFIHWYPDVLVLPLIDLGLAVVMMTSFRFLSGLASNVSTTEELSHRDNPAYGISMAGGIGSMALVMSGALSGAPGNTLLEEAVLMLAYGLLGIALLIISRYLFDRISMPRFSIQDEILKGNMAAGLVDAANTLGTGIIIRAVMIWVDSSTLVGLIAVLSGYVVSQLVLSLTSLYRLKIYAHRHNGRSLQDALRGGNTALAIRFLGHRLGVAMAVTAASGFIPYANQLFLVRCLLWGGVALVPVIVLPILALLARKAILAGINVVEAVDNQNNMAIAAIEAAIYTGTGFLLCTLIV